ncbi:DUF2785 domain-containing protein [Streptomyces sp. NPDC059909]|uniref:DUF2785 domain-containing protein n=1 Tax=Streptomyces sp. NPDC059909 TaxID=3346998 RepID=UPI00365587C7
MIIDWEEVCDTGFVVPAGADLDVLTAELSRCLRDPDPEIRDGAPYVVLRTWIARDVIAGERRIRLGDEMAARFTDSQIQARTFAPLVLDMIVSRGDFRQSWLDAFTTWFAAETDLQGYDPVLGWLHAVAHGADLLGTFGRLPQVDPAGMLDLAAERMLTRTSYVYDQQEDDRLAGAVARVLTRPELTVQASTSWLDAIQADFEAVSRRTMKPVYASNAMRTLRTLYVLADQGVPLIPFGPPHALTHGDAVRARLAEVLAPVFGHPPVKDFPAEG